jgi:hypothetical protein
VKDIPHVDRAPLHAKRRRHGLDNTELGNSRRIHGIPKDCPTRYPWSDLFDQGKSMKVKPVILPPGCDRVATKPRPTGSLTTLIRSGWCQSPVLARR